MEELREQATPVLAVLATELNSHALPQLLRGHVAQLVKRVHEQALPRNADVDALAAPKIALGLVQPELLEVALKLLELVRKGQHIEEEVANAVAHGRTRHAHLRETQLLGITNGENPTVCKDVEKKKTKKLCQRKESVI